MNASHERGPSVIKSSTSFSLVCWLEQSPVDWYKVSDAWRIAWRYTGVTPSVSAADGEVEALRKKFVKIFFVFRQNTGHSGATANICGDGDVQLGDVVRAQSVHHSADGSIQARHQDAQLCALGISVTQRAFFRAQVCLKCSKLATQDLDALLKVGHDAVQNKSEPKFGK